MWAREDVLGRLDGVGLQVLEWMLCLHEERSAEAVDEEVYPAALLSSLPRNTTFHNATTFSLRRHPPFDIDIEDDDTPDAIPSGPSPASRRRIHNCLYMRCKRTEASGRVALLDPARLKPWTQSERNDRVQAAGRGHRRRDWESEAARARRFAAV
jgi:hypothetical protein